MAFRKKTLRTMSPTARKVARLAGEAESVARRLKNLTPTLQRLDLDSKALEFATQSHETELVLHELSVIKGVTTIKYLEINNVESINHMIELVHEHANLAEEIITRAKKPHFVPAYHG